MLCSIASSAANPTLVSSFEQWLNMGKLALGTRPMAGTCIRRYEAA